MRILIDAHIFDEFYQGTRSYIEGLYKAIFEVEERLPSGRTYYLAAADISSLQKTFPEKSFIKYIPLRSRHSYQRLLFEFPFIIRKYQIDYAHFQYVVPFSGQCKYIVTIHDLLFMEMPEHFSLYYRNARKWLFRRSYRKAACVLTVSGYSKSSIVKFYGNNKEVKIVPLALDKDIIGFHPAYTQTEWLARQVLRPYILYVSRFEVRKNHYELLRSFYEGGFYTQYDLVLIGKKSESCKDFEILYAGLPLEVKKRVILKTEGIRQNDLLEFMKHATLFIYPSLAEGFGIPPLEAAVLGTPVVCSNTTSMKDFTFFGEDHVDCSLASNITAAIQRKLWQDKTEQQQQSSVIRNAILARYNWNNSAAIFLETCFK